MLDDLFQLREAFSAEVVFYALDIFGDHGAVEAEEGKELSENHVPALDAPRHLLAMFRQPDTAVFLVDDKPKSAEAPHHDRHAWTAEFERLRDVGDPRITFFLDKFVNAFEVVLYALSDQ